MEKYKCILSVRVANDLIEKGYNIVTIEPSTRYRYRLVFIFENSPELESEMANYKRKD